MIDFFERLDKFIDYKGLNDNKITVEANISNGLIGKARKRGSLSQDNISKILYTYPELNANWLFTGVGEMTTNDISNSVNEPDSEYKLSKSFELRTDNLIHQQQIPVYNIEAYAGLVPLFEDHSEETITEYISIPRIPKCDGALTVKGDSMYPLLKSGDIVVYKQVQDKEHGIFFGEMYLVSVNTGDDEYISVKWLHKSDKGESYVKLVSQNQHHQPKDIPIDSISALAIVKASVRINSM